MASSRALLLALPLLVLLATLGGCGGDPPSDESSLASTDQRIYNPLGQDGRPNPDLRLDEASGSCFNSSVIAPRSDAWRCAPDDGSQVKDPCFGEPGAKTLTCVNAPWATDALVLELTEPLPDSYSGPERPWALELADKRRCTLNGGATRLIAGRRINFGCDDGSFLLGNVDRSRAVWTIFAGEEGSNSIDTAEIAIAWF